jgi:hypothetical protein
MPAENRQQAFVGRHGFFHVLVAFKIVVGKAGFEHNDLVFAAGIGHCAGVGRVLFVVVVQGLRVPGAVRAAEPEPPMADVGVVADAVRPPTVVGIADEVMVAAQSYSQFAMFIVQPVLAAGMMDENQFDRPIRGSGIVGQGDCRPRWGGNCQE